MDCSTLLLHFDLIPDGDFEYTSSNEDLERYMD